MEKKTLLWHTRHQGTIRGPFSSSVITNNIAIGRLAMHDELSNDQINWHAVQHYPELHPVNDNKEKAQKNLDERDGFDRREQESTDLTDNVINRKKDRRKPESQENIFRRQFHTLLMRKYRKRQELFFWPLFTTFSILTAITLLAISFPNKISTPLPNCHAKAMPDINWNNCLKSELDLQNQDLSNASLRNSQLTGSNLMNTVLAGADIAYADLQSTNLAYSQLQSTILLGANLKKADLSYADLSNADLSYSDLRGANLGGSVLTNTRFDNAIWPNGQLCAPKSIGECIVVKK